MWLLSSEWNMDRRTFLAMTGLPCVGGLAGCVTDLPGDDSGSNGDPSVSSGIYYPSHRDKMEMIGKRSGESSSRLTLALTATVPHEFWLVTGSRTNRAEVRDEATMHLMVVVWDSETGLVAPSVSPALTIYRDGTQAASLSPWSMLSQPMGFHYGGNVAVSGAGDYRFEVSLNAATEALGGDLASVFQQEAISISTSFDPSSLSDMGTITVDSSGDPGALSPMAMDAVQIPRQPEYSDIPLSLSDPKETDDVRTAVGSASTDQVGTFSSREDVLMVVPQTRFNRYPLPLMGIKATVRRDGSTVFEGDLSPGVHPDVGHFYAAGVEALETGDEVEVSYSTPPQFARHLGYEVAFFDIPNQTFTL
jgi:hypothetical protein